MSITSVIKSGNNPVVPSDSSTFRDDLGSEKSITKGIKVTVAGAVAMVFADDSSHVVWDLEVGEYPYALKQILATGTTSTGILALF
jgi:hypothetical protein